MPLVSHHPLLPRSTTSNSHYAIIFAVLATVLVIGGVLWGYLIPKWQRNKRTAVQTRYNCIKGTNKRRVQSDHDLELHVVFPPHPAVVVPLTKKRTSNGQLPYPHSSCVPVYDPRTYSPFPNTYRAPSCRPWASNASLRGKDTLEMSKPIYLHPARLRQSQPHKLITPTEARTLHAARSTSERHPHVGYNGDDGTRNVRHSLFVARSAGAPPIKPKAARLASNLSRPDMPSENEPDIVTTSAFPATNNSDHQRSARHDSDHHIDINYYAIAEEGDERMSEEGSFNVAKKSIYTPGQPGFGFGNVFETPSSPGTATSTRFGSSTNRARYDDSTPLTGPNSSAFRPRVQTGFYPGISHLVPSRRFKNYSSTTTFGQTPLEDRNSESDSRLSSEQFHVLNDYEIIGHRPVSGISDAELGAADNANDRHSATKLYQTNHHDWSRSGRLSITASLWPRRG